MTPEHANDRRRVASAYSSKPDPSEPWRYVCPDCGGQVHSQAYARAQPYQCTRCRTCHEKDDLEDKKA